MGEQTERRKYNVSVLKDPKTKEEFNVSLINKLYTLQELLELICRHAVWFMVDDSQRALVCGQG